MNSTHTWTFFRAGGFDQVRLDTGADLAALDQLDQKLWVALACPTTGLEFDSRTLALIDTDNDGRVRAPEIIAAAKWACAMLKNPDDLLKGLPELPLTAINDANPEGKQLLASARQTLINLGKKDAAAISVADTADTARIFAQTQFNGDGIVPADAASDELTKAVINDIIACLGAETDRSGKPGVSQAKVDQYFAEAQAFSDWWKKAEIDPAILPLNVSTAAAAATFKSIKAKVDDYFTRCRLAAYDPRSVNALNREEKEYLAVTAKELTVASAEIAAFPLAQIGPGKPLPLKEGLNPAWADAVAKFESDVVRPLLGSKGQITEGDWAVISGKFAAYEGWTAAKAGASIEKLGLKRVREILAGKSKDTITGLIAKDKALEPEANAIAAVERLVRYHRDLQTLLINFVSFKDFYDRGEPAIFQAGTLYLDQRSCELTLRVEDPGKHAALAGLAGAYLAYCDCVRKSSGEKMTIVAIFSQGDDDNLMVGRNGIFYDRKGRDYDATITKIVANPISLRQAFWSPYKKFVRLIEEQVTKRAAAAEASSSDKLAAAAVKAAQADKGVAAAKPAEPKKVDVGTVAALGVAFGAIGTFLTAVWANMLGIVSLGPIAIVAALVGVILLISGPSMILAYIKLRKRNIGPILDANGWAVNARAKINVPFGTSLTGIAKLPPGSQRELVDPYAEKKSPWPKIIVFLLLLWAAYALLDRMGYIHQWTNGRLGKERGQPASVEGKTPAASAPEVNITPAK